MTTHNTAHWPEYLIEGVLLGLFMIAHHPRGCAAQAWSAAEVLRAAAEFRQGRETASEGEGRVAT